MTKVLRRTVWFLVVAALCVLWALPPLWALTSSLKPLDQVYGAGPALGLTDPMWTNYTEALTRLPVLRFLGNSLFIATVSMVGAVFTSSMAGFALARLRFRGRSICLLLLLVSMMMPAQLLLIPRFLMADWLGWVGTYKPLIVPAWLGGGAFNVLLFRHFFLGLPRTYEDAARLDGASTWAIYRHVLLPMARPAVVAALLLSFVLHWQEFLDPLIYLSDFSTFPISLGLRMYESMAGTWANLLMATSILALLPVVVIYIVCMRSLSRGLGLAGAIDT